MDPNSGNPNKKSQKTIPNILRKKSIDRINPTLINNVLPESVDLTLRIRKNNNLRLLTQEVSNVQKSLVTVSTEKQVEPSNIRYQNRTIPNILRKKSVSGDKVNPTLINYVSKGGDDLSLRISKYNNLELLKQKVSNTKTNVIMVNTEKQVETSKICYQNKFNRSVFEFDEPKILNVNPSFRKRTITQDKSCEFEHMPKRSKIEIIGTREVKKRKIDDTAISNINPALQKHFKPTSEHGDVIILNLKKMTDQKKHVSLNLRIRILLI